MITQIKAYTQDTHWLEALREKNYSFTIADEMWHVEHPVKHGSVPQCSRL